MVGLGLREKVSMEGSKSKVMLGSEMPDVEGRGLQGGRHSDSKLQPRLSSPPKQNESKDPLSATLLKRKTGQKKEGSASICSTMATGGGAEGILLVRGKKTAVKETSIKEHLRRTSHTETPALTEEGKKLRRHPELGVRRRGGPADTPGHGRLKELKRLRQLILLRTATRGKGLFAARGIPIAHFATTEEVTAEPEGIPDTTRPNLRTCKDRAGRVRRPSAPPLS